MTAWAIERDHVRDAWGISLRMDKILYHEKTAHQEVLLFENPTYGRVLFIDGVVQTTEQDEFFYHEMLVHLPVLTHGAVRRALIVGGGDGGALEELLKHPGLEAVTMVEIDRAVIDFSKAHMPSVCGEAFADDRLELVIADAVDWVGRATQRYDVVFIDGTDANEQGGPGEQLYGAAFYRNCAKLLTERGLLITQNAVPFLDPQALAKPYGHLREVFAQTACYRVAVPSFYGGDMVFCLAAGAAAQLTPDRATLDERFAAAAIETRYYSPAIHLGSLALPPWLSGLLE